MIRDAERKGIFEIAAESGALAKKARDGKLGPADMSGGCFTVSSLGGIGGTGFTPIINAPEVAILGVTRAQTKPVWNGKEFVPRLILPLCLSWDHRVIDGAMAARFLVHLAQVLADFRRISLDRGERIHLRASSDTARALAGRMRGACCSAPRYHADPACGYTTRGSAGAINSARSKAWKAKT